MGKRIPGPRKPIKQFKCPWCSKEFITLAKLESHDSKCSKKPGNCRHPFFSRKKKFVRIETKGKKHYELWQVYCSKCRATIKIKRKRTG